MKQIYSFVWSDQILMVIPTLVSFCMAVSCHCLKTWYLLNSELVSLTLCGDREQKTLNVAFWPIEQ